MMVLFSILKTDPVLLNSISRITPCEQRGPLMTARPEKHSNPRVSALRARRDPKTVDRIQKTMELAAAIEDAMIAKKWNRSQFAAAMGVQPSQITRWLSGTQGINTDSLFEMEYVLEKRFVLQAPLEKPVHHVYYIDMGKVSVKKDDMVSFDQEYPLLHSMKRSLHTTPWLSGCFYNWPAGFNATDLMSSNLEKVEGWVIVNTCKQHRPSAYQRLGNVQRYKQGEEMRFIKEKSN